MLKIKIVCIGKLKEPYLKSAVQEYAKRLSKYCKLDIIELPDEKIPEKLSESRKQEIQLKECEPMIHHIKNTDSYVIALDLTGKEYSSEEFSQKLDRLSMTSSNITFLIGGSLGFPKTLFDFCQEKICFSKMTFPHAFIRVFLLEQIFRAFKIQKGETYHR